MNEFTKTIVEWYKENKRELPWRESADPYLIWISEIILQQTRVAQGYDYFLRFIKRFPDVRTLAAAEEDEGMKYWQGLGYYSRARNLHAAAKSMNGVFPETYPEVLALKGVGEFVTRVLLFSHVAVDCFFRKFRKFRSYLFLASAEDEWGSQLLQLHSYTFVSLANRHYELLLESTFRAQ